jgi:hypothetical protein
MLQGGWRTRWLRGRPEKLKPEIKAGKADSLRGQVVPDPDKRSPFLTIQTDAEIDERGPDMGEGFVIAEKSFELPQQS